MSDKMKAQPTGWRVTIPAGTYFLGDPCYTVPDEAWRIVTFDEDMVAWTDGDGRMRFGSFKIDTTDEADDLDGRW